MLTLLTSVALAGSAAFHPNAGPDLVTLDADGRVHGMSRTGDVLVRADDPSALLALPEVAEVFVLRGPVARIVPAPGVDDVALSVALRSRADVTWAHPDLVVRFEPRVVPDDPYFAEQWHLANVGQGGYTPGVDIRAAEAWEVTRGAGQIVAVLDSGVDIDHPDLDVIDGFDYIGVDPSSDPEGDDAHGTAVAGLAAGIGDNGVGTSGVAYEASVYGIRLIGGYATLSSTYDAFVEAVDAGASVLNNSWGFEDGCGFYPDYGIVADAIDYAEDEGRGGLGAAVVLAAGNGNCDISDNGMLAHPAAIVVAAVSGYDVREDYSAFGAWIDLTAPSGGMVTADIVGDAGYNGHSDLDYTPWFNGTSASTPVVSGVVALMFAANERLTAAGVRDVLCDTSVRMDLTGGAWDGLGWSPYYGCGRVDAAAAVHAVANLGPPGVPVPTGPVESAPPDAFVLSWEDASDPDGDHVVYKVRWALASDPDDRTVVETDRPWLDLSGSFDEGNEVLWEVRAFDLWGATEWSAQQSAVASSPPEPVVSEAAPKGCAHVPASGWGLLLLGLFVRRQR